MLLYKQFGVNQCPYQEVWNAHMSLIFGHVYYPHAIIRWPNLYNYSFFGLEFCDGLKIQENIAPSTKEEYLQRLSDLYCGCKVVDRSINIFTSYEHPSMEH